MNLHEEEESPSERIDHTSRILCIVRIGLVGLVIVFALIVLFLESGVSK